MATPTPPFHAPDDSPTKLRQAGRVWAACCGIFLPRWENCWLQGGSLLVVPDSSPSLRGPHIVGVFARAVGCSADKSAHETQRGLYRFMEETLAYGGSTAPPPPLPPFGPHPLRPHDTPPPGPPEVPTGILTRPLWQPPPPHSMPLTTRPQSSDRQAGCGLLAVESFFQGGKIAGCKGVASLWCQILPPASEDPTLWVCLHAPLVVALTRVPTKLRGGESAVSTNHDHDLWADEGAAGADHVVFRCFFALALGW